MRNVSVMKPLRVIFVLLAVLAMFMFMQSAFFAVTQIKVVGTRQLNTQEVQKISGLNPGINIFKANLPEATGKIRLHPLIETVEISRRFPSRLEIHVTERTAVGLIAGRGEFLQVDGSGVFLAKSSNMGKVNLPIITGITVPKTAPGEKIGGEEIQAALVYLKNMPIKLTAVISEINVRDLNNIKLFTIDGAEVRVGNTERVTDKIRLYEEVAGRKYDRRIQYIDISYNGRPVIKLIEISPES